MNRSPGIRVCLTQLIRPIRTRFRYGYNPRRALTVASKSKTLCEIVQAAFHHGNMRIYASDDLIGVEIVGLLV